MVECEATSGIGMGEEGGVEGGVIENREKLWPRPKSIEWLGGLCGVRVVERVG